jgi:hypothetical protein
LDPALAEVVLRAGEVDLEGLRLRVIGKADFFHEKLRAGRDPQRRRSKRLQDIADAQGLIEGDSGLMSGLSIDEREFLERWSVA